VVNFGVDYFGDFAFWFSVNDYRCWQRFRMLWKDIGYSWFEHRDMKHKVNGSYSVQKVECKGLQTGLSNYFVWSEILFGEFL